METTMVFGKFLIVDSQTIIKNGALIYSDDQITDVGTYVEMKSKHRPTRTYGSSEMIVSPGFVNAHGHGRGLSDFQLGTTDDVLEAWKYRTYPGLHSYYDTIWRSLLMLESGITSTMHNHNMINPQNHREEFHRAIDAYESTGIRVGFAPTLIDANVVLYGDRDRFMKSVSPEVQRLVENIESKAKAFSLQAYLDSIDDLLQTRMNDAVHVLHGPLAPQWVTAESLREIRKHAAANDLPIHIHLLQTVLQKEFSRRYHKGTLVDYLASLEILGQRTTCGHAIWLTQNDIHTLANTGTSVTTHSSCNLRIQSGLSPVRALYEAGVRIGIGMDDKTFNDQKDFFEEMRLVFRLHRLGSYQMLKEPIPASECFRMATEWGAEVLGFPDSGKLMPGYKADIILIDYPSLTYPYTYPDHSPIDVIVYRGKPDHVHTVIVAGQVLVENHRNLKTNKEEIAAKLVEALPGNYPEQYRRENQLFRALKDSLSRFYTDHGWYSTEDPGIPYYRIHETE